MLALFGAVKWSGDGDMLLFSRTCRKKAIVFIILPSPPHSFPGVKHVGLIKGKESYKGKVGFTPLCRAPHSLRRPLPDVEGGGGAHPGPRSCQFIFVRPSLCPSKGLTRNSERILIKRRGV